MTDTATIHQFVQQNMLVERYLLSELSGADLEDFEQHMFECSICAEAVEVGQAFTQHLAAAASTGELMRGRPLIVELIAKVWQRIKEFWGQR